MAMVPIVAFFIVDTLPKVLFITGIGWLLFSFISFLIIILNKENSTNLKFNFKHLKTLLTYSLPRVPGDIAFGGLFALPIIIVSHFNYPELAGKMAFSITLLNIVGAAFSPLSLMLLPGISQKLKDKNYKAVMIETKRAIFATVILSGIGLTIYQLFAEEILHLYLGEDVAFWVTDTKIIMSGAVFYALFITLRSVIDAYYVKAVNSINLIISMLFFCLSSIIVGSLEFDYVWFYISFLTSLTLLMILTLLSINKMNKELKLLL
jgi:O-antigen/teichoic acid export membrane protein